MGSADTTANPNSRSNAPRSVRFGGQETADLIDPEPCPIVLQVPTPAKRGRSPSPSKDRLSLVTQIATPLGFFVLALLIIEGTLGIVLIGSKLPDEKV